MPPDVIALAFLVVLFHMQLISDQYWTFIVVDRLSRTWWNDVHSVQKASQDTLEQLASLLKQILY